MTEGPKPVRRIVTLDDAGGKSVAIEDWPVPDVRNDPARPGFVSTRIWVTDARPVGIKHAREALAQPHRMEPPPRGSICRIVTFPPDAAFRGKVGGAEVAAFFHAMGSPAASTYSPKAPHPYMQKTRTLDFCLILDGEITLVLDTGEVHLAAGDTVVQRGTNHARSTRPARPCTVAISSHGAADCRGGRPPAHRAAAGPVAKHDLSPHLESRARPQADHVHLWGTLSRGVPAHLRLQEARAGGRIRVSIRRRQHVEAAAPRRLALLGPGPDLRGSPSPLALPY